MRWVVGSAALQSWLRRRGFNECLEIDLLIEKMYWRVNFPQVVVGAVKLLMLELYCILKFSLRLSVMVAFARKTQTMPPFGAFQVNEKKKKEKQKQSKWESTSKKLLSVGNIFLVSVSCSIIFTWRWTIQSLLHGPTTDMGMLQLPFDIFVRMNVVQVLFFGHYFHSFFYLRSHNWLISCYKLQNARETTFKCHHV